MKSKSIWSHSLFLRRPAWVWRPVFWLYLTGACLSTPWSWQDGFWCLISLSLFLYLIILQHRTWSATNSSFSSTKSYLSRNQVAQIQFINTQLELPNRGHLTAHEKRSVKDILIDTVKWQNILPSKTTEHKIWKETRSIVDQDTVNPYWNGFLDPDPFLSIFC